MAPISPAREKTAEVYVALRPKASFSALKYTASLFLVPPLDGEVAQRQDEYHPTVVETGAGRIQHELACTPILRARPSTGDKADRSIARLYTATAVILHRCTGWTGFALIIASILFDPVHRCKRQNDVRGRVNRRWLMPPVPVWPPTGWRARVS